MSQSQSESMLTNAEIQAYLINMAAALDEKVLPSVGESNSQQSLKEVITLLARMSTVMSSAGDQAVPDSADFAGQAGLAVAADRQRLSLLEGRLQDCLDGLNGTGEDEQLEVISREALTEYLRSQWPDSAQTEVVALTRLAGGRSKHTYLVTQEGCADLPAEFVMRQDWSGSVIDRSVTQEFPLLKCLSEAGIKVPRPLHLEASMVLGAPFMLVSRVPGSNRGGLFDPPQVPSLAIDFARQLGTLHSLETASLESLPGMETRAYTSEQLREELQGFRTVIEQLGKSSPTLSVAMAWLEQNIERVSGPRALVHSDCGFHNFLAGDSELTAILDWELAHFGHPAEDFGYVRSWVTQMLPWADFVAAYQEAGGPAVDEHAVDFYTLWAGVRVTHLLMRARAGIVAGAVRDFELTYVGGHLLMCLLHRLSAELVEILQRTPLTDA